MVHLFKKHHLGTILMMVPYLIAVRWYSLSHPVAYTPQPTDSTVISYLFAWLDLPAITQSIIAIILILLHAVIINYWTNQNKFYLIPHGTAGMWYIILVSMIPDMQMLTPALIANTFIILSSLYIFRVYRVKNVATHLFNSGLLISIASILYPPALFIILVQLVAIAQLRSFPIKERLQYLIGLISIYWIAAISLFYFGEVSTSSFLAFRWFDLDMSYHLIRSERVLLLYVALTVYTILNFYNVKKKKAIDARKKINYFYIKVAAMFLLFALIGFDNSQIFIVISLSLACLLSMSLANKKIIYVETVHVLLVMIMISQLYFGEYNLIDILSGR